MADTLDVQYADLRREVGYLLAMSREPTDWSFDEQNDVEAILKDGLRDFYYCLNPRTGMPHQWSFLYPHATMTTSAPYATGTVGIVSGVVTLAGGTFPSWAANGEMHVDGGVHDVLSRDGDTQVTLLDTTVNVAALTTYRLTRSKYDLPNNFAALIGPITYSSGGSNFYHNIRRVPEGSIREARTFWNSSWPPNGVAVIPKALTASTGQRWQFYFYPSPDAVYPIIYRYEVNPYTVDSTDNYPYGGPRHARTIMYAVLAAAERKANDMEGVYAARFQEALVASIGMDRLVSSPDFLGEVRDPVESSDYEQTPYPGVVHRELTLGGSFSL